MDRSRAKRRRRLVTLALALAAVTLPHDDGSRADPVPQRIHTNVVGGTVTAAFPAVGALLAGEDPGSAVSWCSGVLIGCDTFLTAAHCVCPGNGPSCQGARAPDPADRLVFLQNAGFFRVASVHVHPSYAFPTADVAVLKLATAVTGVAPAALATDPPDAGTAGTLVGFGRTSGTRADFGLKRVGTVTLEPCRGVSATTDICWTYTGTGSDSCDGDSGGPLFVDTGAGSRVAGITSGGRDAHCGPGDVAFDTSVAAYHDWIVGAAGTDVASTRCGGMPQAGDLGAPVTAQGGELDGGTLVGRYVLDVPPGTNELRIAMNGVDDGQANFDLRVKGGSAPTGTDADCAQIGNGQFAYCAFAFPAPGLWYVDVARVSGAGTYQLTATVVGGAAPACGNGSRETGEECDGGDDAACPGACDASCACTHPCTEGDLVTVKAQLGGRLLLRTRLHDAGGAYDRLDPRDSDFALTIPDGPVPLSIVIPPHDRGWAGSDARAGLFRWSGAVAGAHGVVLKCKRLRSGDWQISVMGKPGPVPRALRTALPAQ